MDITISLESFSKEELLAINPFQVTQVLQPQEIIHIAKALDAFWRYDYQAAEEGRAGYHARLRSGKHSDGFFSSYAMLEYPQILTLIANQMKMKILSCCPEPDYFAGIPEGATKLGEKIAELMEIRKAKLKKVNGKIELLSPIPAGKTLMLGEDFCTTGSGIKEAVKNITQKQPDLNFLYVVPVIIDRGGIKNLDTEETGMFSILPLARYEINSWPEHQCPLCKKYGSISIKPKATDENWRLITTGQR
ncbi:MAG: hypothetical protein ACOCUF_03790 [Patescibacteria group bacterium]